MTIKSLIHKKDDSVSILLSEGALGDTIDIYDFNMEKIGSIRLKESIPKYHKVSINLIKKGDLIIEYGYPIGKAREDIELGQLVHIHNVETRRF